MEAFGLVNDICQTEVLGSFPKVLGGLISKLTKKDFIYMPENGQYALSPINQNFRKLSISTSDRVRLVGYLFTSPNPTNSPTIIYFMANAGEISSRFSYLTIYQSRIDCNIVLVGYRGYGRSTGVPDMEGLKLDAEAILKYTFNKLSSIINTDKVFLHGTSLGGTVAAFAAGLVEYRDRISGVVLDSTFCSIEEEISINLPFLDPVKEEVCREENWDTISYLEAIKAKILILGIKNDEMFGTRCHEQLVKKANELKKDVREVIMEKGSHNDAWLACEDLYFDKIGELLES